MKLQLFLGISLSFCYGIIAREAKFIPRLERSLPSVSDDHFQESSSDGSYRYAYTGENSYHAERRLSDGTVEGETLYVRPDGIPIKVHYFADAKHGYRPKTEVLYAERLRSPSRVVDVVDSGPNIVLAPPREGVVVPLPSDGGQIKAHVEGNKISLGNGNRGRSDGGGDNVAISSPSVTAIIGPGGRAELRPDSFASTRSGNGVAISNPSSTAIIGPGGSAVLAPTSRATTDDEGRVFIPVPTEPFHPPPTRSIFTPVESPPPVVIASPHYLNSPPPALIVPSNPSYQYTYSYSSPDSKYPYRDSSAFVNVRVNQ